MPVKDSTLFIVIGSLLVLLSVVARGVGVEHPELFEETPFVGLCAIAIGLLERRKDGAR